MLPRDELFLVESRNVYESVGDRHSAAEEPLNFIHKGLVIDTYIGDFANNMLIVDVNC